MSYIRVCFDDLINLERAPFKIQWDQSSLKGQISIIIVTLNSYEFMIHLIRVLLNKMKLFIVLS